MKTRITAARLDRQDDLQAAASSLLVPLTVTAPGDTPFWASVEAAAAGPAVIARISGAAHTVARQARAISSTDRELVKVVLFDRGHALAAQDGRQQAVRSGEWAVLDTTRPYALAVPEPCAVLAVGLPRGRLGPYAGTLARRTAQPLPSGRGVRGVMRALLRGVDEHIDGDLPATSGAHLADALTALLIAVYADTTAERADVPCDLTERIIGFTRANLADPGLSVESVARVHGISPRHLHQLFRRAGGRTFAAWVRHERLLRVHRDLADPALRHLTTAVIGARSGLHDPSHLSRALRAEFGRTPSEIRRTGGAGPGTG
ncbi:transcriptional regulator, AraC family [Actinacidiphila yanglinensis]|uniref:Transcriptional regulator, AraC family n=1 Tax=Actinacidiphila yanglinensis TaxID=310779 RepID=A0A1H6C7X1_9ACTN|nr:helix-turn-helix domain-containing protein [Actinacidiphila yanglinensis]SEG69002.1 transcriptional regulator, AraC family [Actinacidiphila yanglinensis]